MITGRPTEDSLDDGNKPIAFLVQRLPRSPCSSSLPLTALTKAMELPEGILAATEWDGKLWVQPLGCI